MQGKLSKNELTSILINVILVKIIISYPRKIIETAGNSAWIVSFFITLLMIALFFVISKLYNFSGIFPDKTKNTGNKVFNYISGALLTVMLVLSMTSIVRLYPESVKVILLRTTPMEIIVFLFGIASLSGLYCGIKALGRISYIFIPIGALIMGISIILLIPHMDISNLTPVFGYGFKNIFVDGLTFLSAFSDIVLLYILCGNSNEYEKAVKTGYKVIIITGSVMTIIIFSYCAVFPYGVSGNFLMPYYQLTRVAQIGEMFTRIEALFEFVWTILIMIYFSVYLYAICIVWKRMFNLKYHKPLALPFMITVIFLAMIPSIYLEFDDNFYIYSIYTISVSTGLPVITGIIEKYRRRNKNEIM